MLVQERASSTQSPIAPLSSSSAFHHTLVLSSEDTQMADVAEDYDLSRSINVVTIMMRCLVV